MPYIRNAKNIRKFVYVKSVVNGRLFFPDTVNSVIVCGGLPTSGEGRKGQTETPGDVADGCTME